MLTLLKKTWNFLTGGEEEVDASWAHDEDEFEAHFGESYEQFAIILADLDQAHMELYKKTMAANPEAAITWVFFISGSG